MVAAVPIGNFARETEVWPYNFLVLEKNNKKRKKTQLQWPFLFDRTWRKEGDSSFQTYEVYMASIVKLTMIDPYPPIVQYGLVLSNRYQTSQKDFYEWSPLPFISKGQRFYSKRGHLYYFWILNSPLLSADVTFLESRFGDSIYRIPNCWGVPTVESDGIWLLDPAAILRRGRNPSECASHPLVWKLQHSLIYSNGADTESQDCQGSKRSGSGV